ncbi:hypothetical protein RRG08_022302 [Elysia crispata]|uniref:Uncharacterized protein n=1 Tax=Elysia crispata TaxID=231223 RepID=A0AAE1DLA7_9GAST|nr:hypothetical protein RRG08_022302 [Elysia crispata]
MRYMGLVLDEKQEHIRDSALEGYQEVHVGRPDRGTPDTNGVYSIMEYLVTYPGYMVFRQHATVRTTPRDIYTGPRCGSTSV